MEAKLKISAVTGRKPVVLRVASILSLLGVLVLLVAGCGEQSPGDLAEEMIRATFDGDCETVIEIFAQSNIDTIAGGNREVLIEDCRRNLPAPDAEKPELVSLEITEENIEGERATVAYTLVEKIGGEEQPPVSGVIPFVLEDGVWGYSAIGFGEPPGGEAHPATPTEPAPPAAATAPDAP